MRILMYRSLGSSYPRVDIYLPINSIAISLPITPTEKLHLVGDLHVFLVKDHIIASPIFATSAPELRRIRYANKAIIAQKFTRRFIATQIGADSAI